MKRCSSALLVILALCAAARAPALAEEVRALTLRSTKRILTASAENQWALAETAVRSGQYRESLDLAFAGSIYHPNFLSYDLAAQLGLTQLEDSGLGPGTFSSGLIANLHLLTVWLQEKPYSFSLYADHGEDLQDFDLFERAWVRETAFGGFGQWNNAWAPLYYSLRKSFREEERAGWDSAAEELTVAGGFNRSSNDGSSGTRLDYTYSDFNRRVADVFAQQGRSHDLRFANSFGFGAEKRHRLSSTLYYLNLQGTVSSAVFDLAEALELEHPFGLSSRYFYNLHTTASEAPATLAHEGEIRLTHQLYESLTTTLAGRGRLADAADYREWSAGPSLELAYRKNIRIGYLNLLYSLGADAQARSVSGLTLRVLDERHALTDGTVTFLENSGVDPASVVVTDASGVTVYSRGIDYELETIGGRTRLLRSPGGSIANGAEVLVDYLAAGGGSFELLNLTQTAETRVELFDDRLTLYCRYLRERFPRAAGVAAESLETIDRLTAGVSLDLAPVFTGGEYEHSGSSLSPYDALRLQQTLNLPVAERSLLTFQGAESLLRFQDSGSLQGHLDLQARYEASFGEFTVLSAGGGYRLQGEAAEATVSQWTAKAGVSFQRGRLAASLGYELRASGVPTAEVSHTLRMSVKREF